MKKFLLALVVLTIASGPAFAFTCENGVIMVHNTGAVYTTPLPVTPAPPCVGINNTVAMEATPAAQSAPVIWKVYAVFPPANSPHLKALGWAILGSQVNGGGIIISHNAPADSVFAIPNSFPNVPTALAGPLDVGMSHVASVPSSPFGGYWKNSVNELWWFDGYAYAGAAGEPQKFSVVANSNPANQIFSDEQIPSNADPIAGYGYLGFGQPGHTFCPTGEIVGACCFTDGTCQTLTALACQNLLGSFNGGTCSPTLCPVIKYGACCVGPVCNVVTAAACTNAGGTYYGDDTACEPYPCATPTERTSWGHIKSSYR
jgi:hypothetical protein